MSAATATRIRILWPLGLLEWLQRQDITSVPLVGLVISCRSSQGDRLIVAAVVGALDARQASATAQDWLQGVSNLENTDSNHPHKSVLGVWTPQPAGALTSNTQLQLPQDGPWIALHGSQQLAVSLQQPQREARPQRLLAPYYDVQHSRLPSGTTMVQVFLYSPALAGSYMLVQQQHQQHTIHPPWLVRPPGAVNLLSVLQLLREAHCSIRNCQQQLQQHELQQQQYQQRHSQDQNTSPAQSSINSSAELGSQAIWHMLTALLAWPNHASNTNKGWCSSSLRPRCWRPTRRQQLQQQKQQSGGPAAKHRIGSSSSRAPAGSSNSDASPAVDDTNSNGNGCYNSSTGLVPGLMQHLLGLLAALLLLYWQEHLLQLSAVTGTWLQHRVLQPHIAWLQEAHPGGIKLHFELSYLLASTAEAASQLSAALYTALWPILGPTLLLVIALVSAVGGVVTGLAAAADVVLLVLLPVEVVYMCAAGLYRLQLRCLRATWRLLRGKQKVRRFSDRRRRQQQQPAHSSSPPAADQDATSSDEVSVEQLIVGVLLFTPLVGLMPTTTVWYLSACCCHGVVVLLRLLLVQLSVLLRMQGLKVLVRRWWRPQDFPGHLLVELLDVQSEQGAARGVGVRTEADTAAVAARGGGADARSSARQGSATQLPGSSSSSNTRGHQAVLSYYHVFFEALSYSDVLVKSVDGMSAALADGGHGWGRGGLRSWAGAVLAGNNWGLQLMGLQTLQNLVQ